MKKPRVCSRWSRCSQSFLATYLAIIAMIFSATAQAVELGGTIKGQVTTADGSAVAGAQITVKHTTKGITRSTSSNADGEYVLRNLPVGQYTMTTKKSGYSTARQDNVSVLVGEPVILGTALQVGNVMEEVIVTAAPQAINMSETTAGMSFDSEQLAMMPVDRGFENMMLMTPGVVENGADKNDFNGASSVGGASSAENGYYLNGINITQIQSGLGSFRMPWEAIAQTSVQTGGLDAQFGGALGGVVNSVSKSGTNEFKFGAEIRHDPRSTYDAPPSVRLRSDPSKYHQGPNSSLNNRMTEEELTEYNIWASGPIIKDRAFFYVLYNPIEEQWDKAGNSAFESNVRESDRWFVNTEFYITDSHSIGITAFNTERERTTKNYAYDRDTNQVGEFNGNSFEKDGGQFMGAYYHGELTDQISVDLMWGRTEEEEIPRPANDLPLVEDCSAPGGDCINLSVHSDSSLEPQEFTRDQLRLDFNIDLDDHSITFGFDKYEIDVFVNNRQNGAIVGDLDNLDHAAATGWWMYGISGTDDEVVGNDGVRANRDGVPAGERFIRRRVRNRFSDSTVESKAFYIQDSWQITDDVTFNFGLRYMEFANTVSSGKKYADMDGNFAPRLAAIWDIHGDGKSKLFASFGHYYQPVAARMNITQGSSSIEYYDYYMPVSAGAPALLADGSPERGAIYGDRIRTQLGITDPNLIASKNLKAMYSSQFSLGYQTELTDELTGGVRVTYNKLERSVEDTDYAPILKAKLAELGITDAINQKYFYVLANPGEAVELAYDFDQDNEIENVTLSSSDVALPKPERQYLAWNFTLNGNMTERIYFDASYTWSHSWGNTEGLVKTTNGQADPGWTSDYDYGEVLDHARGNLPNDRRHSFKFAGTYLINDQFTAGLVFRAASGRPRNKLTQHPTGVDSCAPGSPWAACAGDYVGTFYDELDRPSPRGSAGNLPWTKVLDVSLTYRNDEILDGLTLKATVYNVLGQDKPVDVNEWIGPNYGLPDVFQEPRHLSLVSRIEF